MSIRPSIPRSTTSIQPMAMTTMAAASVPARQTPTLAPILAAATPASKKRRTLTDFLVGARNNYTLNNFVIVNYHQMMNFFYVQDDLKVSTKLTVNAGLRYELVTPQWVTGNHLANFIPPAGHGVAGPLPRYHHRHPAAGLVRFDIQPRIGQHTEARFRSASRFLLWMER